MVVDSLVCGASRVKMSGIGGIAATQEVVDLCAKHSIKPTVKIISAWDVNGVYEELEGGNDTGVRHVLDIATLTAPEAEAKCAAAKAPDFSNATAHGISVGGLLSAACGMFFCGKWL